MANPGDRDYIAVTNDPAPGTLRPHTVSHREDHLCGYIRAGGGGDK